MSAKTPSELREQVRGEVVVPDDAGYDDARLVHNGMIDKRPAVVVRVANAGDAMATVAYARDNDLDLSIRGGGHSGPGFGTNDGGVVIDFSRMRGVRVDPTAMTARAEGGVTWATSTLRRTPSGSPRPEASFLPPASPGSPSGAVSGICRAASGCRWTIWCRPTW